LRGLASVHKSLRLWDLCKEPTVLGRKLKALSFKEFHHQFLESRIPFEDARFTIFHR